MMYNSAIGVVAIYFDRHISFALGVTMTGGGVGILVFSQLIRLLIDSYHWRGALQITAGIILNGCVVGLLVLPVSFWISRRRRGTQLAKEPTERVKNDQKASPPIVVSSDRGTTSYGDVFQLSLFLDSSFVLLFLNMFVSCFGTSAFYVLLPDYAMESCSVNKASAAGLLTLTGFASITGRFSMAALMQSARRTVDSLHWYIAAMTVAGIAVILMPGFDGGGETYGRFAATCAVFGFAYGGVCSSSPVVVAEAFGSERLTVVYAYQVIAAGVGSLLGPPFTGWNLFLR